jgi:hypothetical protein
MGKEQIDHEDYEYEPGSLESVFELLAFYINYSIESITGVISKYNK